MKKYIFILLLAIVFLGAITVKYRTLNSKLEEEEDVFEEQIYSRILIENQDFDFGLISVNDTVSYTYQVKNISDEPLIITRIISNCDCVEFDFVKKPLKKNQSLEISTKFIANKGKKGSVNNLMLIECNIEKGAAVLSMSGFIQSHLIE